MDPIPKSGILYSNKFARISLDAYSEVMGRNGLNALLRLAGLTDIIENYPPDNLEKGFDFSDFTALHLALEETYGPRGGRGLALRAGRATFNDALKNFGAMAGVSDLAFKVLPLQVKMRMLLPAAARIFSQMANQSATVEESDDAFLWSEHHCPICWTRTGADRPVCYIHTGLLQAMLTWVSGGLEFRVNESRCCAAGDAVCEYVIQKEPINP